MSTAEEVNTAIEAAERFRVTEGSGQGGGILAAKASAEGGEYCGLELVDVHFCIVEVCGGCHSVVFLEVYLLAGV